MTKRSFQWLVVCAILVTSFASTGGVMAWSGCASYITVQWGDTLSGIAALCGTTADAIRAANPGLGWWLYAGQVLYIPTGGGYSPSPAPNPAPSGGGTYVVQWGDTLGIIAARMGYSVSDILAVNPQIWNASLIYIGQVINLPTSGYTPSSSGYSPAPSSSSGFSVLRVTYGSGLLVRSGPGKSYSEIGSPLPAALYGTNWQYRKNSVTVDSKGFVWVEITFAQPANGYSTGWLLVRDTLGNYFTDPNINP